jgi:hypothetical protein
LNEKDANTLPIDNSILLQYILSVVHWRTV